MKRCLTIILLLLTLPWRAFGEPIEPQTIADRPGMGTGTNVLNKGYIQWETGFGAAYTAGTHSVILPTTLFRFGLSPWTELRLEYIGLLKVGARSMPDNNRRTLTYLPEPLFIGTKIRLWQGSDEAPIRWIPRTSLLLNLGLPLTKAMANELPVSGTMDLLFENDLTDRLGIGYDIGAHWYEWKPTPDIFASLAFNFAPTDKLGFFVESYNTFTPGGIKTAGSSQATAYDINLDFGLTYMVHPRVQLDANAGFNLYHSQPSLSSPANNVFIGIGVTWLIHHPADADKQVQPKPSADCTLQQPDLHAMVGIQGEPLTIATTGQLQLSAPTHFSSGAERVQFGKSRTRSAFLRCMLHHYRAHFLCFRGIERREDAPFACSPAAKYYVFSLRRILC